MANNAQRIVSLLSSNTEMVCALGLGDRLVGISHECDFPPAILDRPRVTRTTINATASSREIDEQVKAQLTDGNALYAIDTQKLVELKPDLILTQAQCEVCAVDASEVDEAVRAFPIGESPTVLSFSPNSLAEVFDDMRALGDATGIESESVLAPLLHRVERVKAMAQTIEPNERPEVLVLEWLDPPMPAGCWTPELVEMAGGKPVLVEPGAKTRSVSWDSIARCNAEVLLLSPCGFALDQTRRELPMLMRQDAIKGLPALQKSRAFMADGLALFNRPGLRLVDSLELLAHIIHPEAACAFDLPCPDAMFEPLVITNESLQ